LLLVSTGLACLATVVSSEARAAVKPPLGLGPGHPAVTVTHGNYRVTVRISPNRSGEQNAIVVTTARAGKPVAATVHVSLAMETMAMGTLTPRFRKIAAGRFASEQFLFPMYGPWRFGLTIAPTGGSRFRLDLVDTVG
jgi:hypothetical protein